MGKCLLSLMWGNDLSTAPLGLMAVLWQLCITDLFLDFPQNGTFISFSILLKIPPFTKHSLNSYTLCLLVPPCSIQWVSEDLHVLLQWLLNPSIHLLFSRVLISEAIPMSSLALLLPPTA